MKNNIKILVVILLIEIVSGGAKAQTTLSNFSPSTSTLIGNASRIGYHNNNWSTFYMRYNNQSYFCSELNDAFYILSPGVYKVSFDQDFVIHDFKRFLGYQGVIGSYQGRGMYGRLFGFLSTGNSCSFITFKLPVVERLKRIAVVRQSIPDDAPQTKAFAIGEKEVSSRYLPQSYLLKFVATGPGMYTPFHYAPMAFDPNTGEQERVDDVIGFDKFFVFATVDTRRNHLPINIRVCDTTDATSINYQMQLGLNLFEEIFGELRLLHLNDDNFILAYVIFNRYENTYYLHFHGFKLTDFLVYKNAIVSHKVKLSAESVNLVDMVYEPDVETMMILLNGSIKSKIFHADPYSNTSDILYVLDYPNGPLHSIDTAGYYVTFNADRYMAMGDNEVLVQDISGGPIIESSCFDVLKVESMLQAPPRFICIYDPIVFLSENKEPFFYELIADFFHGTGTCNIYTE